MSAPAGATDRGRVRFRGAGNAAEIAGPGEERLARAVEWAIASDSWVRQLVEEGREAPIDVPVGIRTGVGRARGPTVAEFRDLQLGVGELVRPVLLPEPDISSLYPFQKEGVDWLLERDGAILADDMGLGKTVQVITALRLLFNRGDIRTAVVLCPKSLLANWGREFGRWAPELGVAVMTPPVQIRDAAWKAVSGRRHILLTNYEQFRSPPAVLMKTPPDVIVADEAHRLRKQSAKSTAGTRRLRPKRFWALSGTPIERNIDDMATLLSLVAPTRFSLADRKLHPASLRSRARKFVLRRRKEEVLEQLPPVLDATDTLDLTTKQETAYRTARSSNTQNPGEELALLTRLMALCDLEPESKSSCKADRVLSQLERIRDAGEKAVVFSYRIAPLHELRERIAATFADAAPILLIGEMTSEERDRAVTRFRTDERALALLSSTRVGGEGLTLTEANHVFLFNQWWNPSANDQARDRVLRIGQKRTVRVYRFLCRGTVEEGLEDILAAKRELFEDVVERLAEGDGTAWRSVLGATDIKRLLRVG